MHITEPKQVLTFCFRGGLTACTTVMQQSIMVCGRTLEFFLLLSSQPATLTTVMCVHYSLHEQGSRNAYHCNARFVHHSLHDQG